MTLENCFANFPYLLEFPIYIDGNNVAYSRFMKFENPILNDILTLIDNLIHDIGFPKENIHCICDLSLKYYIDKPNELQALIKEDLIIEAPKIADEMILGFALKQNFCFIISNDRFREYIDQLPSKKWLKDGRVSFMFIGEELCLSPNIDYNIIDLLPLNEDEIEESNDRTTLDALKNIEKSNGALNLF